MTTSLLSEGKLHPRIRKIVVTHRLVLTIIMFTVVCMFFYILNSCEILKQLLIQPVHHHVLNEKEQKEHTRNIHEEFTIRTEGCTIPSFKSLDTTIKDFIKPLSVNKEKKFECPNMDRPLIKYNRTHLWLVEENKSTYDIHGDNYECCCKQFYRPDAVENVWSSEIDNRIKFKDCFNFTKHMKIKHEFVKVTCFSKTKHVYENIFVFTPKKSFSVHKNDNSKQSLSDKLAYNVIILGLDSVSRLNFHRTMPKTLKFLKSRGAVEMLGYTKVGSNSWPNIIPLLMGYSADEVTKICYPHEHATLDSCPFVWTSYKKAGYYTALAEDSSEFGTFNYLCQGFIRTPTDYYMHPFTHQAYKMFKNSACVGDRQFYKVILEYVKNLLTTIKSSDSKLFGFFWELTITHNYLNSPRLMDDSYVDFFTELEDENYLNDTIFFILSDHGIRFGPIRSTLRGRMEENLPFLYVLTPLSFQEKYKKAFENLIIDSGHLTTPYDVHETLKDLTDIRNIENERIDFRKRDQYSKNRGISLFLPIPRNRTCNNAGIPEQWCTCLEINSVETEQEGMSAAGKIVNHINEILVDQPKCAVLVLQKVVSMHELILKIPGSVENRQVMVVVQLQPGGGLFEGILQKDNRSELNVKGTINRINKYGNQSNCVNNAILRLYCFCNYDNSD